MINMFAPKCIPSDYNVSNKSSYYSIDYVDAITVVYRNNIM